MELFRLACYRAIHSKASIKNFALFALVSSQIIYLFSGYMFIQHKSCSYVTQYMLIYNAFLNYIFLKRTCSHNTQVYSVNMSTLTVPMLTQYLFTWYSFHTLPSCLYFTRVYTMLFITIYFVIVHAYSVCHMPIQSIFK